MTNYTLPATIPFLMVIGSPVIVVKPYATMGVFLGYGIDHEGLRCLDMQKGVVDWYPPEEVFLDLREPTARVHAVWWVERTWGHASLINALGICQESASSIRWSCQRAISGRPFTDVEIDQLRRFILALHEASQDSSGGVS